MKQILGQYKKRTRWKQQKMKKEELYQVELTFKLMACMEGIALALFLSYLFYESIYAAIILAPCGVLLYQRKVKQKQEQMKWQLNLQFQDALAGMTAALSAGYSVENSINEALDGLRCIYKETDLIVEQFQWMTQRLRLNDTIEQTFFEFADRSKIDDIQNFAWILYTAKRTGGDLLQITRSTSHMIRERIEVNREVQTVIAAKRLESNIMSLVPAGIIIYLKLCCKGFLEPLYHNTAGMIVMSIVVILYAVAYLCAERLVRIEV